MAFRCHGVWHGAISSTSDSTGVCRGCCNDVLSALDGKYSFICPLFHFPFGLFTLFACRLSMPLWAAVPRLSITYRPTEESILSSFFVVRTLKLEFSRNSIYHTATNELPMSHRSSLVHRDLDNRNDRRRHTQTDRHRQTQVSDDDLGSAYIII